MTAVSERPILLRRGVEQAAPDGSGSVLLADGDELEFRSGGASLRWPMSAFADGVPTRPDLGAAGTAPFTVTRSATWLMLSWSAPQAEPAPAPAPQAGSARTTAGGAAILAAAAGAAGVAATAWVRRRSAQAAAAPATDAPSDPVPGPPQGSVVGRPLAPTDATALYRRARDLVAAGDTDGAAPLYRTLAGGYAGAVADPRFASAAVAAALWQQGVDAEKRGDTAPAATYFDRSAEIYRLVADQLDAAGNGEAAGKSRTQASSASARAARARRPSPAAEMVRADEAKRRQQQMDMMRNMDIQRSMLNQSWAQNLGRI